MLNRKRSNDEIRFNLAMIKKTITVVILDYSSNINSRKRTKTHYNCARTTFDSYHVISIHILLLHSLLLPPMNLQSSSSPIKHKSSLHQWGECRPDHRSLPSLLPTSPPKQSPINQTKRHHVNNQSYIRLSNQLT